MIFTCIVNDIEYWLKRHSKLMMRMIILMLLTVNWKDKDDGGDDDDDDYDDEWDCKKKKANLRSFLNEAAWIFIRSSNFFLLNHWSFLLMTANQLAFFLPYLHLHLYLHHLIFGFVFIPWSSFSLIISFSPTLFLSYIFIINNRIRRWKWMRDHTRIKKEKKERWWWWEDENHENWWW